MERRIEDWDYTTSEKEGRTHKKGRKITLVENPYLMPKQAENLTAMKVFFFFLGVVCGVVLPAALKAL